MAALGAAPEPGLGLFIRLKLTLLGNTLRTSVWMTIFFALGALSALGGVGLAVFGAIVGGSLNPGLTGQILTLAGAAFVIGWLLVPIIAFGVDATLDPHRFALYPVRLPRLMAGLALAGLTGVPGLATTLAFLGVALAWWRTPAVLPLALITALGAVALCLVGSRALTTWLSPKLESRRVREVMTVVMVLPLVGASAIITPLAYRLEAAAGTTGGWNMLLNLTATVAGWTPFGAPWSVPAAAAEGDWLGALARLLVLAAAIGLALWLWAHSLTRTLANPRQQVTSGAPAKGLGLFARLPATPTGAVAARSMTYWLRDPRYQASLGAIAILPLVFLVSGTQDEVSWMALFLGPLTGLLLGFGTANDIAFDYTAFSLHVAAGVDERADRWGRVLPVLVIGVPVTIAFAVISVAVAGHWLWLPAVLGVSLCAVLTGLGIAAAVSAKFAYPVAKPGESPFKTPQGAAMASLVGQGVFMGVATVVGLPALGLALWSIIGANALAGWLSLVVGLVIGVATLLVGVRLGAKLLARNAPELLQKVHNFA